jgi:hypothetical protein
MPPHGGRIVQNCHSDAIAHDAGRRARWLPPYVSFPYSWLPGTGLNLIPCNETPTGFGFAASIVIAVQTMFVEVAAIAIVP